MAVIVGSFLTGIIWLLVVVGIAGSMETQTTVKPGSVLTIDLEEAIVDCPSSNPFDGIDLMSMSSTSSISLYKALQAIEAAAADDRIEGIYIRPNGSSGIQSAAAMEEIREAVVRFKESGKFVVAYNEYYSQSEYWFASAADKVYLHPEGGIDWHGLASQVMFYKGLLDRLDIKPEIVRPTVCKYKSAVEPYFLDRMSEANRYQTQQMINSIWASITEHVASARGIEAARVKDWAEHLTGTIPEDALAAGMVDGLAYEDEMDAYFAEHNVATDFDGEYETVSLGEYASVITDSSSFSAPKIAVVYANGQIFDGKGSDAIYGNSMAETIASVRKDDKVKAVVLRVNSPGGSALASDVIAREVELLKAEKPVIISMGDYAASGGYYISALADAIISDRLTLTGSIGVYGMFFNIGKALDDKLGISVDVAKTNASADMGTLRAMTPAERAMAMRSVDKVYETFTSLVSRGRNLPIEKVLDIAQGRVWSGTDAVEIGLVDTNGGLKTAIAVAADKAGIADNFRIEEVVEQPEGLMALLSSFNAKIKSRVLRSEMGAMYDTYKASRDVLKTEGIVSYCPYSISFE